MFCNGWGLVGSPVKVSWRRGDALRVKGIVAVGVAQDCNR